MERKYREEVWKLNFSEHTSLEKGFEATFRPQHTYCKRPYLRL